MTVDLKHLRIDRSSDKQPSEKKPHDGSRKLLPGGKRLLLAGAALLVVCVSGAIFLATRSPALQVAVTTVHAENVTGGSGGEVILNATGYIVPAHKIDVATKVNGRVAWIGVGKGDQASAGQMLVRLESDEYQAKVQEAVGQINYLKAKLAELQNGSRPQEIAKANADMAEMQSEMENARVTLQRTRRLAEAQVLSRQALDDATAKFNQGEAKFKSLERSYDLARVGPRSEEIDAARGQLEQAEGTLAYARTQLQNTVIRAPVAGTILERNVEPGEFVTTGFVSDNGARGYVVSLADLHQLQVQLDISQNDFSRLVQDQPAVITTDAYPDRRYEGEIEEISPVANRQKATVEVKVKIRDPDHLLRPDMNASVAFVAVAAQKQSGGALPVISVPKTALRDLGVFVVVNGKAAYHKVRTGAASADAVQIIEGLQEADQLIVNPPASLREGQAVKTGKKE
ncbi:efflux RND transporter periplasmic adaptor subunit [Edaphobacter aggregans]|uniref:efflux RND transporter periplasmic adaptor subunit n=1 Tax=Edaphobacter aggregans TaxID=570835 RepID=UPI0005529C1B|nr:efflux RND transporter periplasmic adaptor subunit [Edaphobacter aggregans]